MKPPNMLNLGRMLGVVAAVTVMALPASPVRAEEQEVRNDDLNPPDEGMVVGDFAIGEMAGVTLTSPCDGSIVALQVLWLSALGTPPITLEENIWVFDVATPSGGNANPGPVLLRLEGPVLDPGYMNEWRYIDEASTIPIDVPVTNGQQFLLALEFGVATDILGGSASVVRDQDGCQSGKNWLYGSVGGPRLWYNFCSVGLLGDLVIRAVIDCQEPTGACCEFDATCNDGVQQGDCQGGGQTFFVGQLCSQVACPPPTGACCIGGGCVQNAEQGPCEGAGGIYAGDASDCSTGVCDSGACCTPLGECSEVLEVECTTAGGSFQPGGTCTPNLCPQPLGACCITEGFCADDNLEADCLGASGEWAGPFTTCFTGLCMPCQDGDANQDGSVDLYDYGEFQTCFEGPGGGGGDCKCLDIDNDNDVDRDDYASFQSLMQASWAD